MIKKLTKLDGFSCVLLALMAASLASLLVRPYGIAILSQGLDIAVGCLAAALVVSVLLPATLPTMPELGFIMMMIVGLVGFVVFCVSVGHMLAAWPVWAVVILFVVLLK